MSFELILFIGGPVDWEGGPVDWRAEEKWMGDIGYYYWILLLLLSVFKPWWWLEPGNIPGRCPVDPLRLKKKKYCQHGDCIFFHVDCVGKVPIILSILISIGFSSSSNSNHSHSCCQQPPSTPPPTLPPTLGRTNNWTRSIPAFIGQDKNCHQYDASDNSIDSGDQQFSTSAKFSIGWCLACTSLWLLANLKLELILPVTNIQKEQKCKASERPSGNI